MHLTLCMHLVEMRVCEVGWAGCGRLWRRLGASCGLEALRGLLVHLLEVCDRGARDEGETGVEGRRCLVEDLGEGGMGVEVW